MLTEDQIENIFERAMDLLDKELMTNKITQTIYEINIESLKEWAEQNLSQLQQIKI
jgi:hypothetical protein